MPGAALDTEEREGIRVGIKRGESLQALARRLDRAPATISREDRSQRRSSPLQGDGRGAPSVASTLPTEADQAGDQPSTGRSRRGSPDRQGFAEHDLPGARCFGRDRWRDDLCRDDLPRRLRTWRPWSRCRTAPSSPPREEVPQAPPRWPRARYQQKEAASVV